MSLTAAKTFAKRCKHAMRWRYMALRGRAQDDNSQFDRVIAHVLAGATEPVIFDVGAHHGESLTRFRKTFPGAVLHAFEPDRDNFEKLRAQWQDKPGVTLNNLGVSARTGTLTFHRNLKSSTSGFHAVNTQSSWAKNRSARHNVSPAEFTEKSYDVNVTDLDSYIEAHKIARIDLLKIDTQGHEDEVLKGAQRALARGAIRAIETELMLGDAYEKSLHFLDIESLLRPHGYRFYALDRGGDLLATPSLSVNAIYVRDPSAR